MPEARVEIQFWTCLNHNHKFVTWTGDVACCDTCGLTSEMTDEWLQTAREVDREEVERLRAELAKAEAAARLALAAIEGAETSCRYHGENPPKAPAWHGGCDSCCQPTRVREALAAIRALTTEGADHG